MSTDKQTEIETGDGQTDFKRTRYVYLCRSCSEALTGLASPGPGSMIPRRCSDCRKAPAERAYAESSLLAEAAKRERIAAEMFYTGSHGARTVKVQYHIAGLLRLLARKAQ